MDSVRRPDLWQDGRADTHVNCVTAVHDMDRIQMTDRMFSHSGDERWRAATLVPECWIDWIIFV